MRSAALRALPALIALAIALTGPCSAEMTPAPDGRAPAPGATTTPGSQESATDLAKQTQNPVADLISVPFQHNFNFNAGPDEVQFLFPK